LVLNKA
jgi:hypothetical protein